MNEPTTGPNGSSTNQNKSEYRAKIPRISLLSAGRARLQVLAAALRLLRSAGIAAIALLVLVRGRIVWSLPVVIAGIVYAVGPPSSTGPDV